jgi:hypothetical protein
VAKGGSSRCGAHYRRPERIHVGREKGKIKQRKIDWEEMFLGRKHAGG